MTIFNEQVVNYQTSPLVFGNSLNIQEYANPRFPILEKLNDKMLGLFWRPEEVSLMKDRTDFQTLTPGEQFIFVSNIQYQILLDSIQGRGPLRAFLPIVSNPELEGCIITWGFFETIHSRSYTHIIRNLFNDPSQVIDKVMHIPEIMERAKAVTKYYDEFCDLTDALVAGKEVSQYQLKRGFYLAMVAVNILEGLRFYVSFVCNFAFGENKKMEGTTKIMSLIARDEAQHLALTQNVINILRSGADGEEWIQVIEDCRPEVVQMFKDASQQEMDWAEFLFTQGQMKGLNVRVICDYIKHLTNKRMRNIQLDPIYPPTRNPFGWLDSWLSSKGTQPAPQETEIESYVVGQVDSNVNASEDFADLGDL